MTTLAAASQTGGALDFARAHVRRAVPYRFTPREQMVLELFFSNTDQHVFLVENLPSNVRASLLAMYSRMKNERGLRGVFVDVLVTNFLASNLESVIANYPDDTPRFLRENHIRTLDEFVDSSDEAAALFREFLESSTGNPGYIRKFANGDKTRKFLSTWLDQYGHNSIARLGEVVVCCEEISILAAKALEHPRAGAGFIELSTRYVDMTKASWYPIAGEIRAAGQHDMQIEDTFRMFAHVYLTQMGRYTQFLGELYPDASEGAIFGEVCDVMANALPAATNTSVGCVVSGEALRSLIKCLLLEGLPETTALAEAIMAELEQSGLGQFARHVDPTEFEVANTRYLNPHAFQSGWQFMQTTDEIEDQLFESFQAWWGREGFTDWFVELLNQKNRGDHDKLPPVFENALMRFKYTTTFRTWREIQRHVLSQNERTLLTPSLGFFQHSKPISDELKGEFGRIQVVTEATHAAFVAGGGVSLETLQYLVPMGFHVGATHTSNLRQLEFLCWQRSGWNVNHEARQVILGFDAQALRLLSWWEIVSRTDRTPAYRLAREKVGVPLG
jgi:thymidylate synthase ThyX